MAWGAVISGAGSGMNYVANARDARHQGDLQKQWQNAYNQYNGWSQAGEEALMQRQHQLGLQGYAAQDELARALGSGARTDAFNQGRDTQNTQLAQALGTGAAGVAPVRRSWMGGPQPVGNAWGASAFQQKYQPAQDARAALLAQMAGQRGQGAYDMRAQGQAGDVMTDIGRQSAEAQQREAAMAAYRNQILGKAQIDYQYMGPSAANQNLMLAGQAANAAGQGMMSYSGSRNSGG
jgi:hypothetical protein